MGLLFDVRVLNDVDETFPPELDAPLVAEYIAVQKAITYQGTMADNELLITADTVVICGDKILEKPFDRNMAIEMLNHLSGETHSVITGVAISSKKSTTSFSATTHVSFDDLTMAEISYYVDHYKPFDKAGAYGIQEWIGHIGVKSIEGSYFNVMGLPVQKLYQALKKIK